MKKVKENIWDEISEIENGGQEGYYGDDWEDLLDPEKAERVHRDAQDLGMSDLDYVNREEKLEKIEDDFAYEIESDDSISITDFNESPLRSFTDVFEEFLGEMEQEGEVHTGYYFHECRDVNDLCNEVLQMQLDGFEETYGVGFDLTKNGVVNAWVVLSDALNVLSKYATEDYPKCNACFEMLVRLAKEYNETLKEFDITEWPRMVTIPGVGGSLNEAKVHQFGDLFILIGRKIKSEFDKLFYHDFEVSAEDSVWHCAKDIYYELSNHSDLFLKDGMCYIDENKEVYVKNAIEGLDQRLDQYLIQTIGPDFLKTIDHRYDCDSLSYRKADGHSDTRHWTPREYLEAVMKKVCILVKDRLLDEKSKEDRKNQPKPVALRTKYEYDLEDKIPSKERKELEVKALKNKYGYNESTKRGSKKNLTEGTQLFYVFIKFQRGTTGNEVIEFSHAMEELYPEADWANPTRDTIVAQNVNMEEAEDILEDAFEIPSYRNYLTAPQSVTIER